MERQVETRPPEVVERIVRALVPPLEREHVMGDLRERFVSTRQYLLDALGVVPYVIASRIRRTQHPVGIAFLAVLFWFGFFFGPQQSSWVVAAIPTVTGLVALILRGVYRVPGVTRPRDAALDIVVYAAAIGLTEGVLALFAPHLLLAKPALVAGFPISCVLLFFIRLQSGGFPPKMPAGARRLSLDELRNEVQAFQAVGLRAVRIEIGACIAVAIGFSFMAWVAPSVIQKVGLTLVVVGAIFVAVFLYRLIRRRAPFPQALDFAQLIAFYRQGLEASQRLSRTYAWWYVAPLSIGPLVITVGESLQRSDPMRAVMGGGFIVLFGGLLVAMHAIVGRGVQKRLDVLGVTEEKPC